MIYKSEKQGIRVVLDWVLSIVGVLSFGTLIAIIGFEIQQSVLNILWTAIEIFIFLFISQEAARYLIVINIKDYFKARKFEAILSAMLLINLIIPASFLDILTKNLFDIPFSQITIIYLGIIQFLIVLSIFSKALRYSYLLSKIKLHPGGIFALSFAMIIIVGALFLMLPKATNPGHGVSFIDALFTSTSCVCVTGLASVDTPTTYSTLGRVILMVLIQVGGLGVMTLTTFFTVLISGSLSIGVRVMMKEFLSGDGIAEINTLLKKITFLTLSIEGLGAISIYFSLGGNFYPINTEYLFSGVFHSVSAFCNAGFALYSDNLISQCQSTYYIFPTTVMFLIIFGGLGFSVISNILAIRPYNKVKRKISLQITPHSKLVIITTIILIFGGGLLIFATDNYSNGMSTFDKFYHSVFFSVSARTAGFNTFPTELLAAPSVLFLIILMWIGASPGSTGGGIKTTTFAVALLAFLNLIRGRSSVRIFKRQLETDVVGRAFLIIFASIFVIGIGSIILVIIEPNKGAIDLIFEAVSAVGTVGLSRNLTFYLGTGAKYVLVILMYVGRIGALNFFLSFFAPPKETKFTLPKANILIG